MVCVMGWSLKLNLLPSGVVRGKKSIIGNGVVLDPWALCNEIKKLSSQGINIDPNNNHTKLWKKNITEFLQKIDFKSKKMETFWNQRSRSVFEFKKFSFFRIWNRFFWKN